MSVVLSALLVACTMKEVESDNWVGDGDDDNDNNNDTSDTSDGATNNDVADDDNDIADDDDNDDATDDDDVVNDDKRCGPNGCGNSCGVFFLDNGRNAGSGKYGDICQKGDECESKKCVINLCNNQGVCTKQCNYASECSKNEECIEYFNGLLENRVCSPLKSGAQSREIVESETCSMGSEEICVSGLIYYCYSSWPENGKGRWRISERDFCKAGCFYEWGPNGQSWVGVMCKEEEYYPCDISAKKCLNYALCECVLDSSEGSSGRWECKHCSFFCIAGSDHLAFCCGKDEPCDGLCYDGRLSCGRDGGRNTVYECVDGIMWKVKEECSAGTFCRDGQCI